MVLSVKWKYMFRLWLSHIENATCNLYIKTNGLTKLKTFYPKLDVFTIYYYTDILR